VRPGESCGWSNIEYLEKQRRWRSTGRRPFNISISDRHTERLYCQYLENEREIGWEKVIDCNE
jgi:hypothetical protein